MQNALATERSRQNPGFSRLVWLPIDLRPLDKHQEAFVSDLQNDPGLQPGDDLLQTTLGDMKAAITDKLQAPEPDDEKSTESKLIRIYLICDQRDLSALAPLRNYIFEQGFHGLREFFERERRLPL